jgi:hypothetical protein
LFLQPGLLSPRIASETKRKLKSALGKLLGGSIGPYYTPQMVFKHNEYMSVVGLTTRQQAATDLIIPHANQLILTASVGQECLPPTTSQTIHLTPSFTKMRKKVRRRRRRGSHAHLMPSKKNQFWRYVQVLINI